MNDNLFVYKHSMRSAMFILTDRELEENGGHQVLWSSAMDQYLESTGRQRDPRNYER